MDDWYGFKIGDEVIVDLRTIPQCDPSQFNGEIECQVRVDSFAHSHGFRDSGRLYLRGDFPGFGDQVFWINSPASIRHVVEISEEIIQSSTQELASWIKELA